MGFLTNSAEAEIMEQQAQKNANKEIESQKFTDIMIDIETLDTKPTAVILSIAVQAFNIDNGKLCTEKLYTTIEINPQIEQGRTTSLATSLWWGKQNERATELTFSEEMSLASALMRLCEYYTDTCSSNTRIWSKSPAFDLVIIKDALGKNPPIWEYNQERDVRTFLWVMSKIGISLSSTPTHIAFEDVENQINDVCSSHKLFNERESISRPIEVLDTQN